MKIRDKSNGKVRFVFHYKRLKNKAEQFIEDKLKGLDMLASGESLVSIGRIGGGNDRAKVWEEYKKDSANFDAVS